MQKLDLQTPNFTNEHIEKMAAMFPHCVTESRNNAGQVKKVIDFDLLKQELSEHIVDGQRERYQINWPSKRQALIAANTPINKTLRPCREESADFDNTQNLYIEGDNLEALKLLQESYLNKVKMIYIDPPYNTGKDFVYKDNFTADKAEYELDSEQRDEDGGRLVANPETNGRYHSDWLSMMYPRLKLARNLLKDDGVIFISIDDNEVHNLRKVCDEIFGEENFVGQFSVENNPKGRKNSRFISVSNEYCLIFGRHVEATLFNKVIPKEASDMAKDENGDYIRNSGKRVLVGENFLNKEVSDYNSEKHYSVYFSKESNDLIIKNEIELTDEDSNLLNKGYERYITYREGAFVENTYTKTKLLELFETGRLNIKKDKIYEKHFSEMIQVKSMLTNKEYDAIVSNRKVKYKLDLKSTSAKQSLNALIKKNIFDFPKNTNFIKLLLSLNTNMEEKDDIILDFFAGSGTTAHAVMQLNAEDNGNRKFIMVQLPEATDEKSEAYKAGYSTIAEIGKERIRRAGKKIKEDHADKVGIEDLDIGFRVLKIDSSNMKDVYYSPDDLKQSEILNLEKNIKEDRTAEDLLFQVLLDWGVDLSLPIVKEEMEGKAVYFVDDHALAACFDDGVDEALVKALAERNMLRVVFKDTGFAKDEIKDNVDQIFKQLSPETEVRAI